MKNLVRTNYPDRYGDREEWDGQETSDFVVSDNRGALTKRLIQSGHLKSEWLGETPRYLIEVKSTMSGRNKEVYLGKEQYRRVYSLLSSVLIICVYLSSQGPFREFVLRSVANASCGGESRRVCDLARVLEETSKFRIYSRGRFILGSLGSTSTRRSGGPAALTAVPPIRRSGRSRAPISAAPVALGWSPATPGRTAIKGLPRRPVRLLPRIPSAGTHRVLRRYASGIVQGPKFPLARTAPEAAPDAMFQLQELSTLFALRRKLQGEA